MEVLAIKEAKAKTEMRDNDTEKKTQKRAVGTPWGNSALDDLRQCDTDSLSENKEETQDNNIQIVMGKLKCSPQSRQ